MPFYISLLFDHPSHAQICAAGEVTGKLQLSGMYWWKKLHEKLLPWIELLFGQLDSNSARPFYLVAPDQSTNEIRRWIHASESFQWAHLEILFYTCMTPIRVERSVASEVFAQLHASSRCLPLWVPGVVLQGTRRSSDDLWHLRAGEHAEPRLSESTAENVWLMNYGKWAAKIRHTHRIRYIELYT